jgi:hypothetical protein
MRISRALRPELPASVVSRLIYSPLGDTRSKEIRTQFTVYFRSVGNIIFSDLATNSIYVYKNLLECNIKSGKSLSFDL